MGRGEKETEKAWKVYLGLGLKIPFILLVVMQWEEGGEGSWVDYDLFGPGLVGEGGGLLGGDVSRLGCTVGEGGRLFSDVFGPGCTVGEGGGCLVMVLGWAEQ